MKPEINTHNLVVDFGKHRGELWTRIPISYLKWLANEVGGEKGQIAEAELNRRGSQIEHTVKLSGHAIDRVSQRYRWFWHQDKSGDEGLWSWMMRIATEAFEGSEQAKYKGLELVFNVGKYYPTLKTVKGTPEVKKR